MNSLTSVLLAASVFGATACVDTLNRASAVPYPFPHHDLRSVQDYVRKHRQTLLTTTKNWATTASTVPIAVVPFPGSPAPWTTLIAMSDGGVIITIPLQ